MTREDYLQYYIQGSDHYLIPKDIFDELFTEMENWKEESQKNCKQLQTTANNCKRLKDNWNKLKKDLIKIRQLTFTKYNKNEWANCLSFNDDILPLIKKMEEFSFNKNNTLIEEDLADMKDKINELI